MPDPLGGFSYQWPLYAAAVIAYLLGSIPFGLLLAKAFKLGDIRQIGSGNIGATNVLRTGRKGVALLTLLLDGGKGAAAYLIANSMYGPDVGVIACMAVVVGHLFPVWLRFRGGKGVATTLGVLLAVSWPVGIVTCFTWLATAALFRFSSLAAIVAMIAAPIWLWLMLDLQRAGNLPPLWPGEPRHVEMAALLAVLVILRHHANIRRLLTRTEPKIGKTAD